MPWTDYINENRNHEERDAVSPIVCEALEELGEQLWGRSLWGKRYHTYRSRGRWVLCDSRKRFLSRGRKPASVKLSVQIAGSPSRGFMVLFEKVRLPFTPAPVVCAGLSKDELRQGLLSACDDLVQLNCATLAKAPHAASSLLRPKAQSIFRLNTSISQ